MIKFLSFFIFICVGSTSAISQSFYFKTGKNFSNYNFEYSLNGAQSSTVRLQSDSGSFFELGTALPFGSSRFSYEFGVSLNEFNSLVENPSKVVKYKTEFAGFDNAFQFLFIRTKRLRLETKVGFGVHTIIFGKQEVGGMLYDLKTFDEFKGLFFKQLLGAQIKLVASNQLNFSIGYDYGFDVFNSKNKSSQLLLIDNNQIKFGVYYNLEKRIKNNINFDNQSNLQVQRESNEVLNNSGIDVKAQSDKKLSTIDKNSMTVGQLSKTNDNSDDLLKTSKGNAEVKKNDKNNSGTSLPTVNNNLITISGIKHIQGNNRVTRNSSDFGQSLASNDSSLMSKQMEPRSSATNKVDISSSSTIKNNSSPSISTMANQVSNRTIQNTSTINQTVSSNTTLPKTNVRVNQTDPKLVANQNSNIDPSISKAIKNLRNSNSKVEKVLADKSANNTDRITKSNYSSDEKLTTVSNNASKTDVLNVILNRLIIIENKLNNLEKKYENK